MSARYWNAHSDLDWYGEGDAYDHPQALDDYEDAIEADCVPLAIPLRRAGDNPEARYAALYAAEVALAHAAEEPRIGPWMHALLRQAAGHLRRAGQPAMADEAEAAACCGAALPYTADALLARVERLREAGR